MKATTIDLMIKSRKEFYDSVIENGETEDCAIFLISRLSSFNIDVLRRIEMECAIGALLDMYPWLSFLYYKGFSKNKGEKLKLTSILTLKNLRLAIEKATDTCSEEEFYHHISTYLKNSLCSYSLDGFYNDLSAFHIYVDYEKLRVLLDLIEHNATDEQIVNSYVDCFLPMQNVQEKLTETDIAEYICNPVNLTLSDNSWKVLSKKELIEDVQASSCSYAYAEWIEKDNPDKYKLLMDTYKRNLPLDLTKYSVDDYCHIVCHEELGILVEDFFHFVLSADISHDEETIVLSYFSKMGLISDVEYLYNEYRKENPNAREISFIGYETSEKSLHFKLLPEWDNAKLQALLTGLQKSSNVNTGDTPFVSTDTRSEDFLYAFGALVDVPDDYKGIIWLGNYRNKPGKSQIIDLLVLMGYDYSALKSKKEGLRGVISSVFNMEFEENNFKSGKPISYAHKELEKIVKKAMA